MIAEHSERELAEVSRAQHFLNENLGVLASSIYQSDPAQALEILSHTKARADERFRDAPSKRAIILNALATIHWAHLQTYDEATECFSESLTIYREEFGAHHRHTLRAANILGDVLRDARELERAEALAREWYEFCLNHFGAEHEQTTRFATNLADAFKGAEKLTDAEKKALKKKIGRA